MSANLLLASSIQPKLLASTQIALTTSTTVYTVPGSSAIRITHAVLCNITSSAVTVSVAVVPSGQTDNGTHTVVSNYSLAANDSLPLLDLLGGGMMGAGDFIAVTCSTGAAVNFAMSGLLAS